MTSMPVAVPDCTGPETLGGRGAAAWPEPPEALRRDVADLRRLLAFVETRRAALAAERRPTVDADALAEKLRGQIVHWGHWGHSNP